jgi:hypothetical protein
MAQNENLGKMTRDELLTSKTFASLSEKDKNLFKDFGRNYLLIVLFGTQKNATTVENENLGKMTRDELLASKTFASLSDKDKNLFKDFGRSYLLLVVLDTQKKAIEVNEGKVSSPRSPKKPSSPRRSSPRREIERKSPKKSSSPRASSPRRKSKKSLSPRRKSSGES